MEGKFEYVSLAVVKGYSKHKIDHIEPRCKFLWKTRNKTCEDVEDLKV